MSEAWEYGEDDFEDDIPDEDDEIRMQILEAEANEVWLEEPADEDEDDEPSRQLNPLFGMLSAMGGAAFPGISPEQPKDAKTNDEDSEH